SVGGCCTVIAICQVFREDWQHLSVKGRPHDKRDRYQIQEQHRGLTDTVRGVAFCTCQEGTPDQREAHGHLGYEIEIRLEASARAEKLVHGSPGTSSAAAGRSALDGCCR